ncbi:hypothetical protein BDB01DRAFT_782171 [Pilobolus umbonatus]|nr:hypothetical protein BDB01DRAFT_782171 [Pilobolus umbonatus]
MSNKQPESIDSLTHPLVHRASVNGHVDSKIECDKLKAQPDVANDNYNNWDLYPQVIRNIENQGTEEQVKHLHELEHHK